MFHLERLPKRLLVVGGGYIAVEFAGVFNGFGVETTVLYRGDEVLRGFDGDVRRTVHAGMERRGVTIVTGDMITSIEKNGDGLRRRDARRAPDRGRHDPVRHRSHAEQPRLRPRRGRR